MLTALCKKSVETVDVFAAAAFDFHCAAAFSQQFVAGCATQFAVHVCISLRFDYNPARLYRQDGLEVNAARSCLAGAAVSHHFRVAVPLQIFLSSYSNIPILGFQILAPAPDLDMTDIAV